jgi:hypothetical protein
VSIGRNEFLIFVLQSVELVVEPPPSEKLLMCALLAELAFVHDENGVCTLYGRESVSDKD